MACRRSPVRTRYGPLSRRRIAAIAGDCKSPVLRDFVGSSPSAGIRYFVWAVSSVLVERSLRKREVTGSIPVGSTI